MPKLPRDVSQKRLLRFLKTQGWELIREGSRHAVVGRGGVHVAVPRHVHLKTGTVAAILKQCAVEDWTGL